VELNPPPEPLQFSHLVGLINIAPMHPGTLAQSGVLHTAASAREIVIATNNNISNFKNFMWSPRNNSPLLSLWRDKKKPPRELVVGKLRKSYFG
jgi:hypothetical protein